MMCMPVKDLGRVSSCWGKKEREAVLCCTPAGLFFFFFFTCSIWLVNHGLYYSSPGINEPGREREKKQRGEKQTLNHPAFTHREIHHKAPQRQNSFAWLNGNISHRVLERGAHNKTATNKRAIVCWLGNPVRDTFNVPYDLFPPLLIKLLITFGCYGHQGDIPQVLSAAWAQKNPHRGTSLSPS